MPNLVISLNGATVRECELPKERSTLGRRPYNDIVLDNLSVSGEHLALHRMPTGEVVVEDLGSTNGTYINGKAIRKQVLRNNDELEVGKYKVRFLQDGPASVPAEGQAETTLFRARLKLLSGSNAGRELPLQKSSTTLGKPGVAVAAVQKTRQGFALAYVEGDTKPTVNGLPLDGGSIPLKHGDLIELAGSRMEFLFN